MGIKVKKAGNCFSFVLSERVGIEQAVPFHALLKENVNRSVCIDMTELEQIDTSIIQIIIAAKAALVRNRKGLRIINPPAPLVEILSPAGLGGEIRFH